MIYHKQALKKNSEKSCFWTYHRKMALKIQWIDLSRKLKNWVQIFSQGISLPNSSFEALLSSSRSGGQAGALGLFTGGSKGADDQRKKMGLDFDLTKACTKIHPKTLTPSVSNLGAKNTQKGHFWACLKYSEIFDKKIFHIYFIYYNSISRN